MSELIVIPREGDISRAAGVSWGPFPLKEARAKAREVGGYVVKAEDENAPNPLIYNYVDPADEKVPCG